MTGAGTGPTQTQQPQHTDQRGQQAEGDDTLGQVVHHGCHRLQDGQFMLDLGNERQSLVNTHAFTVDIDLGRA
jgi:hypothetical protein